MAWEMTCWEICVHIRESEGEGEESLTEVEKMLNGKYQNAQQACKQLSSQYEYVQLSVLKFTFSFSNILN